MNLRSCEGCSIRATPAVLCSVFFIGLISRSAASGSPCDLEPWLNDGVVAGEQGYHVLCCTSASSLKLYPGGATPGSKGANSPVELAIESTKGLRKLLSSKLDIETKLNYKAQGKDLTWKKQPWVLFLAKSPSDAEEIQPGHEAKMITDWHQNEPGKALVLLLFEGGVFRWPTIRIGYKRQVLANTVLHTMARQPALFELLLDETTGIDDRSQDKLSTNLLSDVIQTAEPRLVKSQTEGKVDVKMRSSDQTFLDYNTNPKLQLLQRLTSKLLHVPKSHLHEFQVLRYQTGQHYDAHRDYWDPREFPDVSRFTGVEGFWSMRHATLLWYLRAPDAGGETWFPRAHGGDIPWNAWTACDSRGVKVTPMVATAVLFYNLQFDGDIDEYSWHCGCPVKNGTKWAANSWVSNTPAYPRAWLQKQREKQRAKERTKEL